MANRKTFFSARTTDGTSDALTFDYRSGVGQLVAYGTWDGATVTMQYSLNGSTYQDVPGVSLDSTNTSDEFSATGGEQLKVTVSGAGGSTSLTIEMHELKQ